MDILLTARRFEKIAWKGSGVEYLILNFYSPRGHVQWNVQSIGDIISFRIYMTLIFILTSKVAAQGSRYQEVCAWTCFFFLFFLFCDFPTDFPSFSLFVSLFLFFLLLGIYLIFLFWPCLFTETSRVFEKRQGQSRFSELNFSRFFGIWKFLVSSQNVIQDWYYGHTRLRYLHIQRNQH